MDILFLAIVNNVKINMDIQGISTVSLLWIFQVNTQEKWYIVKFYSNYF
jgi:hypothetical protein